MSLLLWTSAASAALLAPMLAMALYNLRTAPRLERTGSPTRRPRASVLVPARNEDTNLRTLLPSLAALEYPDLEILVLDDESTDGTAALIERLERASGGRIRRIAGAPPPEGWVGKNWACHQLARRASGEILLFCDADVTAAPDALLRTVALLEEADAVTALPRQRLGGWAERAVVPLVAQLPVLALLPLRAVSRSRAPSLSMANGQWLAFRREAYRRIGGHAAVSGEVLEDVALGRRVKAAGLRLLPAVAESALGVRMYRGPDDVRHGFRKNLYALAGGRPLSFLLTLCLFLLTMVYPWAAAVAGVAPALLPLALLAGLRVVGARVFGHGALSVLLHPVGALLVAAGAVESALGHHRGTLRWKGRTLPTRLPAAIQGAGVPGRGR